MKIKFGKFGLRWINDEDPVGYNYVIYDNNLMLCIEPLFSQEFYLTLYKKDKDGYKLINRILFKYIAEMEKAFKKIIKSMEKQF